MALTKADSFLLAKALTSKSTFTLAIVAYALSLGDKTHPQFRSIVSALKREASVKGRTHPTLLLSLQVLTEHRESASWVSGFPIVGFSIDTVSRVKPN